MFAWYCLYIMRTKLVPLFRTFSSLTNAIPGDRGLLLYRDNLAFFLAINSRLQTPYTSFFLFTCMRECVLVCLCVSESEWGAKRANIETLVGGGCLRRSFISFRLFLFPCAEKMDGWWWWWCCCLITSIAQPCHSIALFISLWEFAYVKKRKTQQQQQTITFIKRGVSHQPHTPPQH